MISQDKHQKHASLERVGYGNFHKNEWAIYGTNCSNIESIVNQIKEKLSSLSIAYVDADHSDEQKNFSSQNKKECIHANNHQEWNEYDRQFLLEAYDLTLINGNHYPASNQIVFLDDKKKDSLHRRVEQLTNVAMVVKSNREDEIYSFLKEKMNTETIVLETIDIESISSIIQSKYLKAIPKVNALILTGGKSSRMGKDKSELVYHNDQPQAEFMANICKNLGMETYISSDHLEESEMKYGFPIIKDTFLGLGPMGGILSAFQQNPNAAWMVLACDLPFVSEESLQNLQLKRNPSSYATSYAADENSFPEPLLTIYEPKSFMRMMQFLHLGRSCPRKFLINSNVKKIVPENSQIITNVNTPQEFEEIINQL